MLYKFQLGLKGLYNLIFPLQASHIHQRLSCRTRHVLGAVPNRTDPVQKTLLQSKR